ncbi:MAG: branched-chain amino acid ABC transporter permease [Thaumarchaeota archaeon]|nr:branched-chain amino acid ABC transporter permease [Nitrososphaerota archaeon]
MQRHLIDPTISNAIVYGCLYAMMCVGLTVTYLTTKVPNFAHTDFVVIAIFSSATTFILGNFSSPYLTVPVAVLTGGVVAVLMYLLVLKPLTKRGANIVVLMISTLAVDIILTALIGAIFIDYIGTTYGRILANKGYYLFALNQLPDFQIFGERGILLVAPAVLVLMTISLNYLLKRTRFGVAMRASIENPNLAKVVGVNVERVYLVSWFIAGALAGLGGGLYSIQSPTPQATSSFLIVDIFAGSVLGGIFSIYGAIAGGLIVGISETYVIRVLTVLVNNTYGFEAGAQLDAFQKGIPLGIMIITLLIIPRGLASVDWRGLLRRLK